MPHYQILSQDAVSILRCLVQEEAYRFEEFTAQGLHEILLTPRELHTFLTALPTAVLQRALMDRIAGAETDEDAPIPYALPDANPFFALDAPPTHTTRSVSATCAVCQGTQRVPAAYWVDTGHGLVPCPACTPTGDAALDEWAGSARPLPPGTVVCDRCHGEGASSVDEARSCGRCLGVGFLSLADAERSRRGAKALGAESDVYTERRNDMPPCEER